MKNLILTALLVSTLAGFAQEAMNLKINVGAQIDGGWLAAEGDSIKIVPEDSSFPTIYGAINKGGEFTIEDYIAETPIHDTGNTPVSNLTVINYEGTLGIQEGTKIVNQRMFNSNGQTVPNDAYSLESNKLTNKNLPSGVHILCTEFADGTAGITKFVNMEGHFKVMKDGTRLIGTPKVTNVTIKNTKGQYVPGQEYFLDFIMPGSNDLPLLQQHEPDTVRQSFIYNPDAVETMNVYMELEGLKQIKTLGMYAYDFDGNVLPEANGQIYDSLGTSLGFVTFDENGYAEIRGLPAESWYNVDVAAPIGREDLRNVKNRINVKKRETLNDTLVVNPYFGIIPGDETHKFMLPTNPDDYYAIDSTGTPYNISGLSMNDVLEGQVEYVENTDGQVVSDWVMGRPIAIYGANSEQIQKMEAYAQIFLGNKDFNDYFTVVGTARSPPNYDYNYLEGDVDGGINWGVDGNNTETWDKDMYNDDGLRNAYMVSGGITNAISETEHELGWYSHVSSVNSRPSVMNAIPDHSNIPTDAFVLQYVMDAKTQKFANGIFTGEMSDYRTEVPSFISNTPNNILQIK